MDNEKLLQILKNASGPVSEEYIRNELGVSAGEVLKAIEELGKGGHVILSSPECGYYIDESQDVLTSDKVSGLMNSKIVGKKIVCLDSVESTNTECKRRATEKVEEGLVVTADEQTKGRGRRGNFFHSPKGKGLYFSCVLAPKIKPQEAVNITAWVAVAAVNAIQKTCGIKPQIKWTNDIILNGKKLGGILTEMEIEAETGMIRYIVLGIGINCNHTLDDFDSVLHPVATSLAMELGHKVKRSVLAANLAQCLDEMYRAFPENASEYLKQYRENCCTTGHEVKLVHPNGTYELAFAREVMDDFSLQVEMADGTIRNVSSGEVSVRGLCGYA